jgi:hypothetical protein
MIERLCLSLVTSPARESVARCADIVFCGTSSIRANSPAGTPSGSCLTKARNVSSLVVCANAPSAVIARELSIYPE